MKIYQNIAYRTQQRRKSQTRYWEKVRYLPRYRLRLCLNNIRQRCENPKHKDYQWYGAKGVRNFLTLEDLIFLWMRDKAHLLDQPTIDREKSSEHYTIKNCRFIERAENLRRMIPTRRKRRWYKRPVGENLT